jgi:hypothetical protein
MKNYIDIKVTVWNRLHFADESNMAGIADLIKEEGLDEVIDDKLGFLQSETLYDTEEKLKPSGNDGQATIEVYENGKEIWNNATK